MVQEQLLPDGMGQAQKSNAATQILSVLLPFILVMMTYTMFLFLVECSFCCLSWLPDLLMVLVAEVWPDTTVPHRPDSSCFLDLFVCLVVVLRRAVVWVRFESNDICC